MPPKLFAMLQYVLTSLIIADGQITNWQTDEAAYDQSDDGAMDTTLDMQSINYEPLSQSPARRNSEEDKSSPGMLSCNIAFEDFERLLGSKLSGKENVFRLRL